MTRPGVRALANAQRMAKKVFARCARELQIASEQIQIASEQNLHLPPAAYLPGRRRLKALPVRHCDTAASIGSAESAAEGVRKDIYIYSVLGHKALGSYPGVHKAHRDSNVGGRTQPCRSTSAMAASAGT